MKTITSLANVGDSCFHVRLPSSDNSQ